MGGCLSKKSTNTSPPIAVSNAPLENAKALTQVVKNKAQEEPVKKEIFVIRHRKSHEVERRSEDEKGDGKKANEGGEGGNNSVVRNGLNGVGAPVRTSSCTKEEVDAILIQCGRLSRSSSTGKAGLSGSGGGSDNNGNSQREGGGKRYCGSKRSFDFDNENSGEGRKLGDGGSEDIVVDVDGDGGNEGVVGDRVHRHRQRHRESRTPTSSSQGRRRTPSREREQLQQHQQTRSGSRERGSGTSGNGRRVSRSPGRRSESPITSSNAANANTSANAKPQKMVSVPAMAMDKSNNNGGETIKRIQVKRNVGGEGARTAASPRARSPARTNAQNQQQPVSLSRSNSRKAEQSPYRRNPLSEIDNNVGAEQRPVSGIKAANNASALKLNADNVITNNKGPESLKPHGVTRTRSSRLSRDLDINPEALIEPAPPSSYTALLLEDIHNFHQKTTPPVAFSLPACVTKANSILEAVADLNSSTSANLSSTISESRKRLEIKEPFVESEVVVTDDLMEPSFHKYVTVRRGTIGEGDMDEEESSGSNSFVGSQQHWVSSSTWEPNSADSTDRWTSSRSNKEDDFNPLGFQRNAISETAREVDETRRTMVAKRRDSDQKSNGIGRGRIGSRGLHTMATTTAAAASS